MRTALPLLLVASLASAAPGYLGARLEDAPGGARLAEVFPDTPAAKAGLKSGDVIVRFGDAAIDSARALGEGLRATKAGTKLAIEVRRGAETLTLTLELEVHPRVLLEQPDTSPGMLTVKVARDLAYGMHARHRLDLFLPGTDKAFPIVLWIHAGAWSYGDKRNETALAMRFAERGIGFAPMNYRLSSKVWNEKGAPTEGFVKHPAHAEDCAAAFSWLRRKFAGHPLFIAGHSCGAHLGALLGMDPRYLAKHGLEIGEIKGVGAFGGGYDLVKYHAILASGGKPDWADAHLHWVFGETRAQWIAASPTTYLKGCTMPMYVVGEKGQAMRQYTRDFEEAVKAAGVTSIRFRYADDRTHGQTTPLMSRKAPDPIRDEFIAFVREHAR
jgi:acetyl esterase/lipase